MTKYKLEYIWLDGYEPTPNLRSKTKVKEFGGFPRARGDPGLGLRRQLDPPGRRQRLGLPAPAGGDLHGPGPAERRARDVRGTAARRDAAPEQHPGVRRRRSRHLVRLRAGVLPLSRRPAARLPGGRVPAAAGRVLHRRRPQERRRRRPRDRRCPHRPLHRGGPGPRGCQRRGREGSVGVPDLRQGLEARRRRALDRALSPPAPLRALRRGRQLPPEAARRRARLERLGPAHRTSRRSICARSAARSTSAL